MESHVQQYINLLSPPLVLRLRFIECCLAHYGTFNRSLLAEYFGISSPQASNDIGQYKALAEDNMVYDNSAKLYRRGEFFVRLWPI